MSIKRPAELKLLATLQVPELKGFVAANHFKIDVSETAEVRIAEMTERFASEFRPAYTMNWSAHELHIHELVDDAWSEDIASLLGDKSQVFPSDLWFVLNKYETGEIKRLFPRTDHEFRIFIRSDRGILSPVCGRREDTSSGWSLYAGYMGSPSRVYEGNCIISL
jgi:hypothetical protein